MASTPGVSFNGHSILFIQFSQSEDSRTYLDFDKVEDGCEALTRIYESVKINKKKEEDKSDSGRFEYELSDFLKFLDSLYDIGAMVYSDKAPGYMAHGKEWLKAKIYTYMKENSVEK